MAGITTNLSVHGMLAWVQISKCDGNVPPAVKLLILFAVADLIKQFMHIWHSTDEHYKIVLYSQYPIYPFIYGFSVVLL